MRSKLTPAAALEVERLVTEGLALDAIGERLGVHRRTILRWVERDADLRRRYRSTVLRHRSAPTLPWRADRSGRLGPGRAFCSRAAR